MNKNELIADVADRSGLSKADAARAVDGMISSVEATLKAGDEVRIVGFGTFSVVKRGARAGINPQTGEKIKIKASKSVKFKPGAKLKAAI